LTFGGKANGFVVAVVASEISKASVPVAYDLGSESDYALFVEIDFCRDGAVKRCDSFAVNDFFCCERHCGPLQQ